MEMIMNCRKCGESPEYKFPDKIGNYTVSCPKCGVDAGMGFSNSEGGRDAAIDRSIQQWNKLQLQLETFDCGVALIPCAQCGRTPVCRVRGANYNVGCDNCNRHSRGDKLIDAVNYWNEYNLIRCAICGRTFSYGENHNCVPRKCRKCSKEIQFPDMYGENHDLCGGCHLQQEEPLHDPVKIEVIDAIEDWKLGFHLGNVVKYVARSEHKGNAIQDLEKAAWYLQRKIEQLKGQEKK